MLGEKRVYGSELYKLEPKELGNVSVTVLSDFLLESVQVELQNQR